MRIKNAQLFINQAIYQAVGQMREKNESLPREIGTLYLKDSSVNNYEDLDVKHWK